MHPGASANVNAGSVNIGAHPGASANVNAGSSNIANQFIKPANVSANAPAVNLGMQPQNVKVTS